MTAPRKPYITKGGYQDMMRTSTDYQSRNYKHSEMKKPYLDNNDLQDMEATSDANSGMTPPWLPPNDWHLPDTPITDPARGEAQHVFMCSADGCYCPGETTCINFSCMTVVPVRLTGVVGDNASGLKGKGGRIDSGSGVGQICITTSPDTHNIINVTVKGVAYDGVKVESEMMITPCEYRAYSDKCAGCTCGTEAIGYTTNQMSTGSVQTLTVVGAVTGCTYNWAITSGGGSLSASTGTSVTYTAPATNANCANNPTITMSCGSTLKGTLKIAVNGAGASDSEAYRVWICTEASHCPHEWCNGVIAPGRLGIGYDGFYCDGTVRYTCTLACCPTAYSCSESEAICSGMGFPSIGTVEDKRSGAQLAAGCCPATLL